MSDSDGAARGSRDTDKAAGGSGVRVMLAVIAAVAAVLAAAVPAAIHLLGTDSGHPQPKSSAAGCPGPSGPVSHGQIVADASGGIAPLRLTAFDYSLGYGRTGTNAPLMYLEATGRLSGQVPADQDLYPFEWADPTTVDSVPRHNHGSAMYFWGHQQEIIPDARGCWTLPVQALGYSGAQGMTFRFYLGLVARTQTGCLQALLVTKAERALGLTHDALTGCGVRFIGYAIIPTQPA